MLLSVNRPLSSGQPFHLPVEQTNGNSVSNSNREFRYKLHVYNYSDKEPKGEEGRRIFGV